MLKVDVSVFEAVIYLGPFCYQLIKNKEKTYAFWFFCICEKQGRLLIKYDTRKKIAKKKIKEYENHC